MNIPRESRFTGPGEACPHPEWWSSVDSNATELEASILIAGLVRATQPEFVVETGSWDGQTTELIGKALMENGHGALDSIEIDSEICKRARQKCSGLVGVVNIINGDSFQYISPKPINFLFVDGAYDREGEVRHLLPYMDKRSMIVVHDSASAKNQTQMENIINMCGGSHIVIDIPRGLLILKLPAEKISTVKITPIPEVAPLVIENKEAAPYSTYPSEWVRESYQYLKKEELDELREIIRTLPKGCVCVNIGAGFGTAGIAFMENPAVGKLYTIDIYETESQNTLGNLQYERGVLQKFDLLDYNRYFPILADSAERGVTWDNEELDMVFIDGDHSYHHCKADILAWLPHIKTGGIIAFHDYREPIWPGVGVAIDELLVGKHEIISKNATFIAFRKSE